jgi:predicted transcriptional regulator
MKAAKEVLSISSSLQKSFAKFSINFMTLETLCKELKTGKVGNIFIQFFSNL